MSVYYARVPEEYTTVFAAISGVLASGLNNFDTGYIFVTSGSFTGSCSFTLPSGTLHIEGLKEIDIADIVFDVNGELRFKNVDFGSFDISGSGTASFYDSRSDQIDLSGCSIHLERFDFISGTIHDTDYVKLNTTTATGAFTSITFQNINNLICLSGYWRDNAALSTTTQILTCSSVYFDHCRGYSQLSSGTPLVQLANCPDIIWDYGTYYSTNGYIFSLSGVTFPCSSRSNYSIFVGISGSDGPINLADAALFFSSGSYLYDRSGTVYPNISGWYANIDPKIVNAASGDFSLDINSPCACAAERLESFDTLQGMTVTKTVLTADAIRFHIMDQGVKAVRPSGFYLVRNGDALYLPADTTYDDRMDVLVNVQYEIDGSGTTFQSLDHGGGASLSPSDYRLIPYMDVASNQEMYYVEPFTMFSFSDMVKQLNGKLANVWVSGMYQFNGLARDSFRRMDNHGVYWVGEEVNDYLYCYSNLTNEKLDTWPLFIGSGAAPSVQLTNITGYDKTAHGITFSSKNIYVNDHYETRTVQLANTDGLMPFQSFVKDPHLDLKALCTFGDYLLVLCGRNVMAGETILHNEHDLYFFNKYEQEPFEIPTQILSGVWNLTDVLPRDMTINDMGELLVGLSGTVYWYEFVYDYALAVRNPANNQFSLFFREEYEGVQV